MKLFENILFLTLTISMSLPSLAQTVSREEALTRGASFLSKNLNLGESHRAGSRDGAELDFDISLSTQIVRSDSVCMQGEAFYVVQPRDAEGFVIVAGDERMAPVLAYSDHSGFSSDDMPEVVREWLEGYAREYAALPSTATAANSTTDDYITENEKKCSWMPIKEGGVSPLLGDRDWGQREPYNWMTPLGAGTNYHCVTGCVATAIAQVMAYHKWPERGQGTHTYTTPGVDGEITVDFSQSVYDWGHMLDVYKSGQYTTEEGNAVALLMRDCGVAMNMKYGTSSSGAYTFQIPELIPEHFDYTTDMCDLLDYYVDHFTWQRIALRELNDKRPIIYSGYGSVGHCFVVDGYQMKNTSDWPYYHVNWGWPVASNSFGHDYRGYYLLSSLKPIAYHVGGYATYEKAFKRCDMIINFKPSYDLDDEPVLLATFDYSYGPQPNYEYLILDNETDGEIDGEYDIDEEYGLYYSYDIMLQKLVGRDFHGTVSLRAVNSKGVSRELYQEEVVVTKKESHVKSYSLKLPDDMEPEVYTMEWYIREQGSERDSMLYEVSSHHLIIRDQTPLLTAQVVSTSSERIRGEGYSVTIEVTNQSQSPFYGKIHAAFLQPEKSLQDTIESDYVSIPAGATRQVTLSGKFCYLAPLQTEIRFMNGYDMSEIPSSVGGEALTYSAMFEPYIPELTFKTKSVTSGTCDTDFKVDCYTILNEGKIDFSGDFRLVLRDLYDNTICPIGDVSSIPCDPDLVLIANSPYSSTDFSTVATLPETVPNGDYRIVLEARQTNAEQWGTVKYQVSYIRVTDDYLWFYYFYVFPENYFFIINRPYYCGTPSFYNIIFAKEGYGTIWNDGKSVGGGILVKRGGSAEVRFEPYFANESCIVSYGNRDLTPRLVNNSLKFENVMENREVRVEFGELRGDLNKDKKISIGDLSNLIDPAFDTDDFTTVDLNYNGRLDQEDFQIMAEKISGELTYPAAASKVMGEAPYHEGYTFVNMGLPEPYDKLLWATCNVGAKYPYETGGYFAWGETWENYYYTKDCYYYTSDDSLKVTKYQGFFDQDTYVEVDYLSELDGLTELQVDDDAAYIERGGNWRIPSKKEWKALIDNCTMTTYYQGHPHYKNTKGIEFTGPNGNKLFLPMAGFKEDEVLNNIGCFYWSRDLDATANWYYDMASGSYLPSWDPSCAFIFWCYRGDSYCDAQSTFYRHCGLPIRPVIDNEVEIPEEGTDE